MVNIKLKKIEEMAKANEIVDGEEYHFLLIKNGFFGKEPVYDRVMIGIVDMYWAYRDEDGKWDMFDTISYDPENDADSRLFDIKQDEEGHDIQLHMTIDKNHHTVMEGVDIYLVKTDDMLEDVMKNL